MNLGNPIEVVPFRATTGLCGGAIHCPTVPCRVTLNAKDSQMRAFAFYFSTFATLKFSNIYFSAFASFEFCLFEFLTIFAR